MAMEQKGYVAETDGIIAKVRVDRESACGGNCASCHGCPRNAVLVSCPVDSQNPVEVGDVVMVVMPTGRFFSGLLKSYGVLILTVLAGAVLGYSLRPSEGVSVLGAFLGLVIGGVWISFLSKKSQTGVTMQRLDRQEDDNERTKTN